jgi:glycosyltransferase involved in cell wall biosynthesis
LHVLVAAHDFYPDPGSGGTGRYVYETTRRFASRGHDVSVITRRRGATPDRETVDGVNLYRYDVTIAERSAPEILSQLPRAAGVVARHVTAATKRGGTPEVVSYQGPVTSALVGRAVDDAAARVATFHSPWPTEYRIKTRGAEGLRRRLNVGLRRFVERCILARTDEVVVLSDFMRRELRRVYGRSRHATVVPGGVDADRFTPDGRTVDRIGGDPAVLTVRRLSDRMGHELLIEAFSAVLSERPGARLYIAGSGPLRSRLEAVARAHGVAGATTFLGYVPDDDLPAVYRSADIFVLPTRELEGFGLATLEALASGLPVVATPVGGTVELLSGLQARPSIPEPMLVASVDADTVASGMLAWADLPEEALADAARTCRRYTSGRFTWDRTAARLESLYDDLLSDGATSRSVDRTAP